MDPVTAVTSSPAAVPDAVPAPRPVPRPDVTASPALAAFADRLHTLQPHPAPAVIDQAAEYTLPQYTLRYELRGTNMAVQVLDPSGRIVRSIPSGELLRAMLRENLRTPRLDALA